MIVPHSPVYAGMLEPGVKRIRIIARDYGIKNGLLTVETRGTLVQYALQQLRIDDKVLPGKPSAQQIIISNFEDIQPWLFN